MHGRAGLCVGGRLVRAQQVEQVGRVAQDQAQVLRQPRVRAGPVHQRVHQLQQPEQRLAVQAAQLLAKVCAPALRVGLTGRQADSTTACSGPTEWRGAPWRPRAQG